MANHWEQAWQSNGRPQYLYPFSPNQYTYDIQNPSVGPAAIQHQPRESPEWSSAVYPPTPPANGYGDHSYYGDGNYQQYTDLSNPLPTPDVDEGGTKAHELEAKPVQSTRMPHTQIQDTSGLFRARSTGRLRSLERGQADARAEQNPTYLQGDQNYNVRPSLLRSHNDRRSTNPQETHNVQRSKSARNPSTQSTGQDIQHVSYIPYRPGATIPNHDFSYRQLPPTPSGDRNLASNTNGSYLDTNTQNSVHNITPPNLPSRPDGPSFGVASSNLSPRSRSAQFGEGAGRSVSPASIKAFGNCRLCKQEKPDVSYCPSCRRSYCQECWDKCTLHDGSDDMEGPPHEKTSPRVVERVKSIIEPLESEEEQVKLHIADDGTAWFGVFSDPLQPEQLYFNDLGRYEEFLSQTKTSTRTTTFPSLISVVGPTGAGKSTLVKALLKIRSTNSGDLQTPVVGLKKDHATPTSGDVHLYWDQQSMSASRPLLFADCEGFGGGSMEPKAVQATLVKEPKVLHKERKSRHRPGSPVDQNNSHQPSIGSYIRSMSPRSIRRTSTIGVSYSSMSPRNTPMPSTVGSLYSSDGLWLAPPLEPFAPAIEEPAPLPGWTPSASKAYRGIPRTLVWAKGQTSGRQYIVENLYPRILYTFSDIVVLVIRNPKQLENEISRLISWASKAIEMSTNQPMLPYAIIVVNAVDVYTDPEWLNAKVATERILEILKTTVHKNPAFMEKADQWRRKNKQINTLQDLIKAYYTDIKILYIPDKTHPQLVWRQYGQLRDLIDEAADHSRRLRQKAHHLLNADRLAPYLQLAFDHFSQSLDQPFDFVSASAKFNDLEARVKPIQCLIKYFRAARPNCDIMELFLDVAPIVASSILLNMARSGVAGGYRVAFPSYSEEFRDALKSFFDQEWPCEARHPRIEDPTLNRCVVVKTRHGTKGHQLRNGKSWSGPFESSRDLQSLEPYFTENIQKHFNEFDKVLEDYVSRKGIEGTVVEARCAFGIHKSMLRERSRFFTGKKKIMTNKLCLSCLYRVPKFPLPCGHVICEMCFEASAIDSNRQHLSECPVCGEGWGNGHVLVEMPRKPDNCGLRILSLDGGGVRALTELIILEHIQKRMLFGLPIQELFDLMVGTSGGGIVALALGECNMTVSEAIEMFKAFALRAFSVRKGAHIPIVGRLIQLKYHSKYESKPLEEVLKSSFGENLLFGGCRQVPSPSKCKVAVTTVDTNGNARLLANYNRAPSTKTPYIFQRFDNPLQEMQVWEAARATSAAPSYFRSYYNRRNGATYQDGALRLNNPVMAADYERNTVWPTGVRSLPDILLSLGTGQFPDAEVRPSEPGPQIGVGVVSGVKAFVNIGRDFVEDELDCDRTWDEFVQKITPNGSEGVDRFHRLTARMPGPKIGLDDVDKMPELEAYTRDYCRENDGLIRTVANQLLASVFYFDFVSNVGSSITGVIRCRLSQSKYSKQNSMHRLIRGLRHMDRNRLARAFRIMPSVRDNRWNFFSIPSTTLERVYRGEEEFGVQISFDIPYRSEPTAICLNIFDGPYQMISGFPRCLLPQTPNMKPSSLRNNSPVHDTRPIPSFDPQQPDSRLNPSVRLG